MLVRAATSDQAGHGRFPRIRKPRLVSIRDLALPAVRPEGKRPGVRLGRHPNVQIAHLVARCPAEDGVTERDFRKREEQKPGSAST